MALFISGAMRSTATDVACLHAGLPPLRVLINQLCQRATLRMATLPETHPLKGRMRKAQRYVQRHRAPIHELIHAFDIQPDAFEVIGAYRPSHKEAPELQALIHGSKDEAKRYDRTNGAPVRLYSDGSAHNGGVRAAAALFRAGKAPKVLHLHLGDVEDHTVYEAEVAGMGLAMELLKQEVGRINRATLGVDNNAALRATEVIRPRSGHHLVRTLVRITRAARKSRPAMRLQAYWTPGHIGIEGNEFVDNHAKLAAAGKTSATRRLPRELRGAIPRSLAAAKQAYLATLDEKARLAWSSSPRYERLAMRDLRAGRAIRFFHKAARKLSRRQYSLIVQLWAGHVGLNSHLQRIGKANSADCPHCEGVAETVSHFLLECGHYQRERAVMQRNPRTSRSLVELLANPDSFKKVAQFVDSTGRLSQVFGNGI